MFIADIPMLHCKDNRGQGMLTVVHLLPGAEALNNLIALVKQSIPAAGLCQ